MVYRIPAPDDRLHGDALVPEEGRLADFWRWAFSDLCDDYTKGFFAEWMVGTLLGLRMPTAGRISFANWDLISPNGIRIEVKATAYWQSWRLFDEQGKLRPTPIKPTPISKISFGGLRAHKGAAGSNVAGAPGYKSDVYVFCFEKELDPAKWNALDLSQWEFYVVDRADLERLGTKRIMLTKLRTLGRTMSAREFQDVMRARLDGHAA